MKTLPSKILRTVFLAALVSSCASTGPEVSSQELKQTKEVFNQKFFQASRGWMPRIYRVGYRLLKSPVPGHSDLVPKYQFTGVGVDELKDYARKAYAIEKSVKGVLVVGTYPGSQAEKMDVLTGDVITKINGKKVKSLGSYFKKIRSTNAKTVEAEIVRQGKTILRTFPVEKVYYNAQFFLEPTPNFDANSLFSKIQIGIGALRYCRNDDELSVIMGHELAHTVLKHSLKTLGVGIGTGLAYGAVAGVVDAFTFPGVGNLVTSPIQRATDAVVSRRYEREADYYGMQHALHAGFNVGAGAKIFSRLASDAPGFQILAYTFSTHPESPERFLRLEKMVEEFRQKFPEKFPLPESRDWDLIVPMNAGENLEEAVQHLLDQELQKKNAAVSKGPVSLKVNESLPAVQISKTPPAKLSLS
ncbi:MAG: PDZ domain-containing protein [Candidatus Omnitrophica bacterium]|nr:PDZ domain-containing protein [Candidatus Omnitrophota bacterium]